MKKSLLAVGLILTGMVVFFLFKIKKYDNNKDLKFVNQIGIGINIGNSLDSTRAKSEMRDLEYETYWHNPVITEELFTRIKEAGFGNVRIPVSWDEHLSSEGAISTVWLERVAEVCDMALKNNLYVILDLHHESWLSLELENEKDITTKLEKLWQQIANRFIDYDEHLIFEGMNEPRLQDSDIEYTSGNDDLRQMVNRLNKVFCDTVRKTGGNNEKRYLMIATYCNNTSEEAVKALEIPGKKVIVSVHGYKPYNFCLKDEESELWNDEKSGTKNSDEKIEKFMSNLYDSFCKKGIPVVITEFAAYSGRDLEQRKEWLTCYLKTAKKYGIPCIYWEDGSNYKLIDRNSLEWLEPDYLNILVNVQ